VAATDLVRPSTRIAMVWPQTAILRRDVADLRALPSADSELVDQAHYGENVVLLDFNNKPAPIAKLGDLAATGPLTVIL